MDIGTIVLVVLILAVNSLLTRRTISRKMVEAVEIVADSFDSQEEKFNKQELNNMAGAYAYIAYAYGMGWNVDFSPEHRMVIFASGNKINKMVFEHNQMGMYQLWQQAAEDISKEKAQIKRDITGK